MRRILVATDGSPFGDRAVDIAADLAKRLSASLLVVTVGNEPSLTEGFDISRSREGYGDFLETRARTILANAAERARALTPEVVTRTAWGDVATTVLGIAQDEKVDLIVLGRRGLGRLARLLIGSASQKIAALSKCPVMVVP